MGEDGKCLLIIAQKVSISGTTSSCNKAWMGEQNVIVSWGKAVQYRIENSAWYKLSPKRSPLLFELRH